MGKKNRKKNNNKPPSSRGKRYRLQFTIEADIYEDTLAIYYGVDDFKDLMGRRLTVGLPTHLSNPKLIDISLKSGAATNQQEPP